MNEVVTRTLSGIIYIALLIGAILFSANSFFALFIFFLIIAVYEFSKLYRINYFKSYLITIVITLTLFITHNNIYNSIYLIVLPFSFFLIFDLFKNNPLKAQTSLIKYLHLIGYVILPFLILTQIPFVNNEYTPILILSIFIMIWCNDTFAYICGKLLGKHKLYEKISPKKTIEGFIGGVIFTLVAAYIIFKYSNTNLNLSVWICLALGISVMGTIGDLVESKYKRQANIKDSGKIMPGHGGILDRLDSIIFAAPFLFLIYKLIV